MEERPKDPSLGSRIEQQQAQHDQLPFIDIDESKMQRYQDHRAVQLATTTTRIAEVRGLLTEMSGKNPSFQVGELTIDNQFLKGMGKVAAAEYDALAETNELGRHIAHTIVDFSKGVK